MKNPLTHFWQCVILFGTFVLVYHLSDIYDQIHQLRQERQSYSDTSTSMLEQRIEAAARDEEEETKELAFLKQSAHYAKLGD